MIWVYWEPKSRIAIWGLQKFCICERKSRYQRERVWDEGILIYTLCISQNDITIRCIRTIMSYWPIGIITTSHHRSFHCRFRTGFHDSMYIYSLFTVCATATSSSNKHTYSCRKSNFCCVWPIFCLVVGIIKIPSSKCIPCIQNERIQYNPASNKYNKLKF